MNKLMMKT